jgi:hypothetical protein
LAFSYGASPVLGQTAFGDIHFSQHLDSGSYTRCKLLGDSADCMKNAIHPQPHRKIVFCGLEMDV